MEYLDIVGVEAIQLVESCDANDSGIMFINTNGRFKEEDKDRLARLVKQMTNYTVVYLH